jgi:hypothetical protein
MPGKENAIKQTAGESSGGLRASEFACLSLSITEEKAHARRCLNDRWGLMRGRKDYGLQVQKVARGLNWKRNGGFVRRARHGATKNPRTR